MRHGSPGRSCEWWWGRPGEAGGGRARPRDSRAVHGLFRVFTGAVLLLNAACEVYRATDTNLKRAAAIKVLPASVATDPERVTRFRREAEVLAAFNHPNVAQIHGIERSGDMIALVMELIEGPTLADLLAGQPDAGGTPRHLSLDVALPIARQIAEALEAARRDMSFNGDEPRRALTQGSRS